MAINLFLDANILLSFYALSNADITQLAQLKGIVSSGDIRLFVSDQLRKEVSRNREVKIQESFKALRDDSFKCHAPSFVKSLKEFEDLQSLLKEANKKHVKLIDSVSSLIEKRELDADKLISEIIKAAGIIAMTSSQFEAAYRRFLVGDPPGKKKSTIGDELNWEFLLGVVPDEEDLHFVTIDKDYASPDDPKKANAFLLDEWKEVKKSQFHFYRDLNDFFKLYVPNIKLANQAKLNVLIMGLAASGSFASTHSAIARFPEDPDFADSQVIELMNIKFNNSQVGSIEGDADVAAFYAPIKERYFKLFGTTDESEQS